MKREIKTKQTHDKILSQAIIEFSSKGYEAGSLNTISQQGSLSKGIIYHYFNSKKELYLACIRRCFTDITEDLKARLSKQEGLSLQDYFSARSSFFLSHPEEADLFCQAVLYPPDDLISDIKKEREDFDHFNGEVLRRILSGHEIRSDLSEADVFQVFRQFQDFLNAKYHQSPEKDSAEAMKSHEQECITAMSILLYGIFRRE
jgi:AcrR family transcriptional regulator